MTYIPGGLQTSYRDYLAAFYACANTFLLPVHRSYLLFVIGIIAFRLVCLPVPRMACTCGCMLKACLVKYLGTLCAISVPVFHLCMYIADAVIRDHFKLLS